MTATTATASSRLAAEILPLLTAELDAAIDQLLARLQVRGYDARQGLTWADIRAALLASATRQEYLDGLAVELARLTQ